MPLRGATPGTPARSLDGGGTRAQEAAARALSIGSGGAAGSRGSRSRRGGRRRCRSGRAARGAGGRAGAAPHSVSRREADSVRPRAAGPGVVPRAGKTRCPPRAFRGPGAGPGPPASPLRSRGAAGRGTPTVGSFFEGFPSSPPSPGRRGPGGDAGRQRPSSALAAAEARTPAPRSALPRTSPGSGSKIPNPGKKERARGRGRCGLGALPALLWEGSSAATGGAGLRERSGEEARCSAGSDPTSSLRGGGCFTARRGAGGGSPRGARPPGGEQMLVRSSPRAPSFLKYCKVFGDAPGSRARAENSGDLRCGVRGGEAGAGEGCFSGSQLRGWCAGVCEPRRPKALSLRGRNRWKPWEAEVGRWGRHRGVWHVR